MSENEIKREYFQWLCNLVNADPLHHLLWTFLHNEWFIWVLPMDENRAEDGKYLRYLYSLERVEKGRVTAEEVDHALSGPCTILEFLVGLAKRIEDDIMYNAESDGSKIDVWFWEMIRNLGLEKYDDAHYNEVEIKDIVTRFMLRKYPKNGSGNIFKIGQKNGHWTKNIEIWEQVQLWATQ